MIYLVKMTSKLLRTITEKPKNLSIWRSLSTRSSSRLDKALPDVLWSAWSEASFAFVDEITASFSLTMSSKFSTFIYKKDNQWKPNLIKLYHIYFNLCLILLITNNFFSIFNCISIIMDFIMITLSYFLNTILMLKMWVGSKLLSSSNCTAVERSNYKHGEVQKQRQLNHTVPVTTRTEFNTLNSNLL